MLLVPLTSLTLLRQGAMQGFGQVVSGQIPEYLVRPLIILMGVLLLHWIGDLTASSALGVNVFGVSVAFLLGTVLLFRALPPQLRQATPQFETAAWMRASLPMLLIAGVWVLNNYIGTLVAGWLDGPAAAGVYNVVQNSAGLIVLFLVAANMPLAPTVARLHAREDPLQLERTTERIARAGLLVSTPVCAVFALFPDTFLGLFGSGFKTGSAALTIVALGQLFNAASGPSGNVLMMTGNELVAARAVGIAAAMNLLLAIALVPSLGVTGSAIAYTASLVLWNVSLVLIARRRLGVNVTCFRRLSLVGARADST
jgi:O-antigen/teichoic acid export membrane protein